MIMVPVQKLVWSPALVPRLLFLIQRMVLLRLLFLIQRMVLLRRNGTSPGLPGKSGYAFA